MYTYCILTLSLLLTRDARHCFMVQTLERAQHELQTTRPFVKYPNVYYLSYQSALAKVISVNRYSLYWRATKAR